VRILVADDHEVVRAGVCKLLEARPDIQVCGQAADGLQAVDQSRQLLPDLVILDITMPGISGLAAAKEIRRTLPRVPILFLSMHDARPLLEAAKAAGGQGFVNKSEIGAVLLRAIDVLSQQQTFWPQDPSTKVLGQA
jgi:DNA-binding NarL/FixJ family response regulator